MTEYTAAEVRGLLAMKLRERGAAERLAQELHMSPSYITAVRQGKWPPSPKILAWLGLERQIVYRERG